MSGGAVFAAKRRGELCTEDSTQGIRLRLGVLAVRPLSSTCAVELWQRWSVLEKGERVLDERFRASEMGADARVDL